ncbi:WecB/TagA/CpsF family glycosyltransferase [Campylobacter portucalensis]|uniref:WecB/TagA/CpsF family glycosyltransferase n=1 Tax=Campylobacter portucalensis TaxID=2608384 RepID=UPI002DD99A87|nr:WecB/TagA/CpsF family glycosyltransferase [Campylobacter portucalensis]
MLDILKNQNKKSNLTTFLNPYSYCLARKHKELFKHFNIKIDGILLVKFLKFAGFDFKRESFDMTSLAPEIFNQCINEDKKIFIVGTNQQNLDQTINNIKDKFRGINIIGCRNGYFTKDERVEFIDYLVKLNPDILICGMGAVLQEEFLLDLKKSNWGGVGYTCGGFLHQSSNSLMYYPKWMDRYHLRWLYRFFKEPIVRKRILIDYPKFLFLFMYDYFKYKNK